MRGRQPCRTGSAALCAAYMPREPRPPDTTQCYHPPRPNVCVSKMVPNPTKGRKWNPRMAAQEAEATLRHTEIVGNVQISRGGLGLGPGKLVWSRADPKEKSKLVVEQVHRQEEMLRQWLRLSRDSG